MANRMFLSTNLHSELDPVAGHTICIHIAGLTAGVNNRANLSCRC
jgi:hypothetical protein